MHPCIEVQPHTGRKHQVRAHMGFIGHPLVGDPLYRHKMGGRKAKPPAPARKFLEAGKPGTVMFLHAAALELPHPATSDALYLADPLPADFDGLLADMRRL